MAQIPHSQIPVGNSTAPQTSSSQGAISGSQMRPENNTAPQTPPSQRNLSSHKAKVGTCWLHAYGATLIEMTIVVHIVASIVTIILYALFSSGPDTSIYPIWYAPVIGALGTYLVFLVIAALCCTSIATVESANRRSYGLLKTRLRQMNARLEGVEAYQKYLDSKNKHKEYCRIALNEAWACYNEVHSYLYTHRMGLEWVTGVGYINMWGALHRAEEALIKAEPEEMVVRGAMHDKLAIQNSRIGNRDDLLQNLLQAISDLVPASGVYFKKYQLETNAEVLDRLEEVVNKLTSKSGNTDEGSLDRQTVVHANARMAISEVRRTLNDFRDGLWEGIIRERNQLFTAMSITALVTHLLLCVTIIIGKPSASSLLGVLVFYLVGAVAGLFAKLYNDANQNTTIDDYGLAQARLIATPLLSGLAGIGGVLITIILYTSLLTPTANARSAADTPNSGSSNAVHGAVISDQPLQISMEDIFRSDEPGYLLTAAVFGLAPNLIISSLQQRTQRYTSDLQKSKSGGQEN